MLDNRGRILFLDDDENFLRIIELTLEAKGHDIDCACSIERGLQIFKSKHYDIAIVDLKMPGIVDPVWGGMGAISTLIRMNPFIQIIVLTAYDLAELKVEAIDRGAFTFVEKSPQLEEQLDKAINYAYASRRSLFARAQMIHFHLGHIVDKFCQIHPYEKNVFIMMRYYKELDIFKNIERIIKSTLSKYTFIGHLARDRDLSDDLWENVRIYMHSCKYGLAIFEQIKDCDFNPNISLEIGYMYAMGRECLLLKDKYLPRLPTDICGKLYKDFDHQRLSTLENIVEEWAKSKL